MNMKLGLVFVSLGSLLLVACSKSDAKTDTKPAASAAAPAAKPAASPAAAAAPADKKAKQQKGGGKTAATEAKSAKQKLSESTKSKQSSAKKKEDAEIDSLNCDEELEGLAWCDSDTALLFCHDGDWYELDCNEVETGGFCGFNVDDEEVSCFVDAE